MMDYQFVLKNVRKEDQFGSVIIRSLKDVNLEIEKGSFTTIYGPAGSGKSKLLSILSLMEMPSAGEFFFGGKNTGEFSVRELSVLRAAKIGFVPQIVNLNMTISVLENVSVAAMIHGYDTLSAREKAGEWLDTLDLGHRFNCTPLELNQLEIKKTGLAKAMIKDPEVLLIDDPYYRLTAAETAELQESLHFINQVNEATVIQATRSIDISKPGPVVYHIQDGKTIRQSLSTTAA